MQVIISKYDVALRYLRYVFVEKPAKRDRNEFAFDVSVDARTTESHEEVCALIRDTLASSDIYCAVGDGIEEVIANRIFEVSADNLSPWSLSEVNVVTWEFLVRYLSRNGIRVGYGLCDRIVVTVSMLYPDLDPELRRQIGFSFARMVLKDVIEHCLSPAQK